MGTPACDPGVTGASGVPKAETGIPHARAQGLGLGKGGGLKTTTTSVQRKADFHPIVSSVQDAQGFA